MNLKKTESCIEKIEDPFPNKMSLDELRKIWNNEYCFYTDDELMRIREWLYTTATIIIAVSERIEKQQAPVISLQSEKHENTKSYSLRSGEYRRAG